jgi:hypothetical protein
MSIALLAILVCGGGLLTTALVGAAIYFFITQRER